MSKLRTSLVAFFAAAGMCASAQAATIFLGAYPSSMMMVDEASGKVTGHIPLVTGLPSGMRMSPDKKRIYVNTLTHSGIEVIDVATRKVINHFELDTPTTRYRFNSGGTADPTGKYFYAIVEQLDKQVDHFDVGKPKYTVIDLEQHKIVKQYDIGKQEEDSFRGYGRGRMEISPDGKYLYQFGDKVLVLDTSNFKVVERIELTKADLENGLDSMNFGAALDTLIDPGHYVALFNAPDAIVHSKMFGIANFDLQNRKYTFTPIGPAPDSMTGLQVAPNKKDAYVVVSTGGNLGNKRCEFWHFDLASSTLKDKAEFACRTRYYFGISGDGKKLYIYGAGYEIEVYDAATLKRQTVWDLNNDTTMAGIAIAN